MRDGERYTVRGAARELTKGSAGNRAAEAPRRRARAFCACSSATAARPSSAPTSSPSVVARGFPRCTATRSSLPARSTASTISWRAWRSTSSGRAAIAYGRYLVKVTDRTAALTVSRRHAELVITPASEATGEVAGEVTRAPRLAYRVELFTEQQAGVEPGLWVTLVEATTGEILDEHNALHLLSQASGPGGNPKVTRSWVSQLDVEPYSGSRITFVMDTARLRTLNMNHATSGGAVVTGPLSPIGDAAINDAHGFAEVALNHMLDWYGQNSINGAGLKIVSRVHYGNNFCGGFWDGSALTWGDGDGDGVSFYAPQGSLDVVAARS